MESDLRSFVKEALSRGVSREKIRTALEAAGWRPEETTNALDSFAAVDFPVPVPRRKPYLSAREAFMYLLMFFTLYTSSVAFGTLLFQFINRRVPDPLARFAYEGNIGAIRGATASIIIAFPIFLLMSWMLERVMARDPEKRGSKIRRWLTYFTLFVAAGVIIGDLISLVTRLLGGELTARFALKIAAVFLIAAAVFGYYLWDLRKEEKEA